MFGIIAWPQSNILGGGGYVDLTGEKNKPIEEEKPYGSTNVSVDKEMFSTLEELINFYKTKYPVVINHTGPFEYKYKGEIKEGKMKNGGLVTYQEDPPYSPCDQYTAPGEKSFSSYEELIECAGSFFKKNPSFKRYIYYRNGSIDYIYK